MKNILKNFFVSLFLIAFIIIPVLTGAQTGTGLVYECTGGLPPGQSRPGECTFQDLVTAVNRVINQVTAMAVAFSVVVIAFAGFRYMKSGDNPSERTKANEMMRKVVLGIFFMLAAWLIVNLITTALGARGFSLSI